MLLTASARKKPKKWKRIRKGAHSPESEKAYILYTTVCTVCVLQRKVDLWSKANLTNVSKNACPNRHIVVLRVYFKSVSFAEIFTLTHSGHVTHFFLMPRTRSSPRNESPALTLLVC